MEPRVKEANGTAAIEGTNIIMLQHPRRVVGSETGRNKTMKGTGTHNNFKLDHQRIRQWGEGGGEQTQTMGIS